jgi:ABC-type transport system involved in multi-copper enzyme maturation permease subunit
MRALAANVEEVFREAIARWTLIAYFVLSSLVILIFAAAVNLDIVNGALAGAKFFGQPVMMNHHGETPTVNIGEVVTGFESGFSSFLYIIATFLAIFSTAHLVPRLQEKGTIDLYLSRPMHRMQLLLSRYVAGLALAAANVAYLLGVIWLIVVWKTHVVHPRFLLGGVIIMFAIATMLALAFVVGVVTSSTAVSIMVSYAVFLIASILAAHEKFEAAVSTDWSAALIRALYWIFPKTVEIGKAVFAFVAAKSLAEVEVTPWHFASTGMFAIACLALAAWLFQRKEF